MLAKLSRVRFPPAMAGHWW